LRGPRLSKTFETRFYVDEEKAVAIARRLYDDFYGQKGVFQGYRMPEVAYRLYAGKFDPKMMA